MPRYYLGVDGGGTNCRIRLADENLNTLADAAGGRSNLQIEAGEPAYRSIMEGTNEAFAKAGIDYAETASSTHACFGMAGGRLPSAREAFEKRTWPFAGVKVYDDIDIARAGAHGGEDGAVIIVGTGSAALAMVDGQRHQCGGWGFQIGDQMSGAILGRELVRYAVEAADGLVEGSPLTQAVIDKLGGTIDSVMDWSFPQDPRGPMPAGNGAPSTLLRVAPRPTSAPSSRCSSITMTRAIRSPKSSWKSSSATSTATCAGSRPAASPAWPPSAASARASIP